MDIDLVRATLVIRSAFVVAFIDVQLPIGILYQFRQNEYTIKPMNDRTDERKRTNDWTRELIVSYCNKMAQVLNANASKTVNILFLYYIKVNYI